MRLVLGMLLLLCSTQAAAQDAATHPLEAAGFYFGSSERSAADACRGAGGAWVHERSDGFATCTRVAAPVGFPATVVILFHTGLVDALAIESRPMSREQIAVAYKRAAEVMTQRYGRPVSSSSGPDECFRGLTQNNIDCFDRGVARAHVAWTFPGRTISLVLARSSARAGATIRVLYSGPARASHLPHL